MALISSLTKRPHRSGVSLVELMIVLGISSLLVGGSFAWLQSQRVSDFFNQMRQIESQIRLVQSQITSNELPGFNAGCQNASRTTAGLASPGVGSPEVCPIGQNQQVFATAVEATVAAPDNNRIAINYLSASTDPATRQILTTGIQVYAATRYDLIDQVMYVGDRVATGTCESSYDNWSRTNLLNDASANPGHTVSDLQTEVSRVAFRRDPNVFNYFPATVNAAVYTAWGGDDPTVTLNAGGTIPTMPCAVMWEFESEERLNGGPDPRFTGEIVFDIRNRSIKLQTR